MSWIARTRTTVLRSLYRGRWSRLDLDEVAVRFTTPARVHDFMRVCFEYVLDADHHGVHEHWQLPEHTLARKRGDCEDWALFAREVLRRNGYEARILAAFTIDDGHATCVVRERERWHTLCNQGLVPLAVRATARRRRERERLARQVADRIFPGTWVSCSWVRRLELRPAADGLEGLEARSAIRNA